ncbi:MAG: DNA polymerase III subunit beta [Verrucomicrobiia bacterium]
MTTKFQVTKEKILDGLQRVQNIVSTRTTLPILSNVLLQAGKDGLCLTTTDLDVGVRCTVEAEVSKPGATTLPARKLFSILKEVAAAEIEVEVDDKHAASIRCGSSFYKIMGLAEEEFPRFPRPDGAKTLKIEQAVLRDMLRKTAYAASTDETRYVLNGVYMSFKGDKLTVVATDGRRLALVEREIEVPKGAEADLILPTKAVAELQRLLGDKDEVNIAVGENQIICNLGATTLVSKLIEGTYPNFRQVIPTEAKERVQLERETLLAALHRASILASEKSQSVKLSYTKNTLTITATTPEVGEAKETLSINYKGKELTIAFNPQYLMDPLRNLDADEVFMELTDELSPGVIKINAPFLYVLMPMRLS